MFFPPDSDDFRTAGARICLSPEEAWGEAPLERASGPDGDLRGASCSAGDRGRGRAGNRGRDRSKDQGKGAYWGRVDPSLSPPLCLIQQQLAKAARIKALRCDLARLEGAHLEGAHKGSSAYLPLGSDELHAHLPGPGLPCGTLNEIAAEAYGHTP